jgi:hypothetical protein
MFVDFPEPVGRRFVWGLLTLFFRDALRIKKAMRKAQNAAGVSTRPGFATTRMVFLAATSLLS